MMDEEEIARTGLRQVAHAISNDAAPGTDATGGHVACLTEAIMGVTAALMRIAEAMNEVAEAIRDHKP
jgi:hypothetical protein